MENQAMTRKIKLYGEVNGRLEYAASLLSDLQDLMTAEYIKDDYYRMMLIRRADTIKTLLFDATDIIDGREVA